MVFFFLLVHACTLRNHELSFYGLIGVGMSIKLSGSQHSGLYGDHESMTDCLNSRNGMGR